VNSIRDISSGFPLTETQQHAFASAVSGKTWFSKELAKTLKELKYPTYFMDFETLGPAIPRFVGMSPFDQIPFQWSVHVQRKGRNELEHCDFLAEDASDSRLAFLESLIRVLGDTGHIVVYNQSFESGVLASLDNCFPEYKSAVNGLQRRLWDLLPVIRPHTYHINYQGSFSPKDVLPALVPKVAYEVWKLLKGMRQGSFLAFTKTSILKARSKWIGITLPCLSTLSPGYAKGRPNAFLHGFGIMESWGDGFGNVYVPVIVGGRFSFAGRIYGR
jgi:hypothetical protein